MAFATIIKNSSEASKNLTRTQQKTIILLVFLTLLAIFFASCLTDSSSSGSHERDHEILPHSVTPILHPIINNACTNTLYPSLCFTTLSSIPAPNNASTFHHILELSINRTVNSVMSTHFEITVLSTSQDSNSQEKKALNDCLEMLDQTLYELEQAIDDLHDFSASSVFLHRSYGNLKTLLSAAMTNENTCIDGLSDLEEADSENQKGLKDYLQNLLTPISRMISNCLAIIKYMETMNQEETSLYYNQHMLITKMPRQVFPSWMTSSDRNLMETVPNMRPDLIVSNDGSGDFPSIAEAVRMAPQTLQL